MRSVSLGQFLTERQIIECINLYALYSHHPSTFVVEVTEKVIRPDIERIDRALGQLNDPRYLGYAVLFVMQSSSMNPKNEV